MKSNDSEIKLYKAALHLAGINSLLHTVMDSDNTLTDKEYNSIREAHDSIASARDVLERLTKQKPSNKE